MPVATALDADLHGERLRLAIGFSRPVGFDAFMLDGPRRLVVDLPQHDWQAGDLPQAVPWLSDLRRGLFRPGTARLVIALDRPLAIARAFTLPPAPGRDGRVVIDLVPTDAETFSAAAGWPEGRRWEDAGPRPAVRVALDPGHGGHDPGAEAGGLVEKTLVHDFARELASAIDAHPQMEAVLTRAEDRFIPLSRRIDLARAADADLMLSLHADLLPSGDADGVSVYSFGGPGRRGVPGQGGRTRTAALIRGPGRDSLIADTDLSGETDLVSGLVVGLARRDTAPASRDLARSLLRALDGEVALIAARPHRHGAFAVLKAADIPAVLVEIGFLNSEIDQRRFRSDAWRRRMTAALVRGIAEWAELPDAHP